MGMAATSISLSPSTFPHFLTSHNLKDSQFLRTQKPSLLLASPTTTSAKKTLLFHTPHDNLTQRSTQVWKIYATSAEPVPPEAIPLETSQQIVATSDDDGVSITISALLFVAFVGLSILTIGVIYLAVTDFLQKREREKLDKDEAADKKKGAKKKRVRARAGPKGFGQKLTVDEEEDDD